MAAEIWPRSVSGWRNGPAGNKLGLVVKIPPPAGSTAPATPTGIVANTSHSLFAVGGNGGSAFIFDTEDGTISGWGGGTMVWIHIPRRRLPFQFMGDFVPPLPGDSPYIRQE